MRRSVGLAVGLASGLLTGLAAAQAAGPAPSGAQGMGVQGLTTQVSDQSLPPGLTALVTRPDHRLALLRAAEAVVEPGGACPAASFATTGQVGLLAPLRVGPGGAITSGAWKEQVRETGCGPDRLLNTLTIVGADGALRTQPLLPGTTITDPQLQRDSVDYAAAAMGALPPGCDQGAVVDTRFLGMDGQPPGIPPETAHVAPWTELWTLQACSKRAEIVIHFRPDANGTDIRAEPPAAS